MNELNLPVEVVQISKNVSVEKKNEAQKVLNHVFDAVQKMKSQLESVVVENENDTTNMKLANTIRLGVRRIRLDAEKKFDLKRSEVQEQMRSFKTEDQLWLKAKQTMQILTKEIEEAARWKEETAKRFEEEKKKLILETRKTKVNSYYDDISVSEYERLSEESFEIFLNGIKSKFEKEKEEERIAEEKRLAQIEAERIERERIKEENERLKKEAEESARLAKIEAEKRKKEEDERKAKAEAERKLQEEEEAKLQNELNKGDAEKLKDLISDFELLKTKYSFKSKKNKKTYTEVGLLIDKVINHIKSN